MPLGMNFAGDNIGDQHVVNGIVKAPKFQYDMMFWRVIRQSRY
jgi:hypothetical protein